MHVYTVYELNVHVLDRNVISHVLVNLLLLVKTASQPINSSMVGLDIPEIQKDMSPTLCHSKIEDQWYMQ